MISENSHRRDKVGRRTRTVAVTGSAGSGKSLVCERLQQKGMRVISADQLAREAVVPGSKAYRRIVSYFGERVVGPKDRLDRRALRRLILENPAARKSLEEFVHPEVLKRIEEQIAAAEKEMLKVVVVEVPLLYEIGLEARFDHVILVTCDDEVKIRRLMQRDRITRDQAQALLRAQLPDKEKMKRQCLICRNDGSMADLAAGVDRLFDKILQDVPQ